MGNLSKGMQLLNGIYTQKFNRRHNKVGHVFQGRFKASSPFARKRDYGPDEHNPVCKQIGYAS